MAPTLCRTVPRSLVCTTLALVLGATSSSPVAAASARSRGAEAAGAEEAAASEAAPDEAGGDSEALSAAAVERFEANDYDGAVALFEQAYAVDSNPNFLFNIGRVYEEKGDLENAVVYYQRFLAQPGVDLESRQATTERLKVLREALAQLRGDDAGPAKDEGTAEPPRAEPSDALDEKAAKRKKILRITGYSLMGAGGAGLIVGAVFGGLARGSVGDADADPFIDRKQAFRERAARQARVADAMFITGGVLAAAGLVLVLSTLGGKKAKAELGRKTMWSPVVGAQHVGLGMTRRF